MKTLCVWLILLSVAFAQDYEWYWMRDFSGGLRTDLDPTTLPNNAALKLENAVFEGRSLKLRPGYTLWAHRIDSLIDGSLPSPVRGIRGLYEFYDDITEDRQVMAVIHDEVWWTHTDSSAFYRVGLPIRGGQIVLADNDSVAYGINSYWLEHILPEDGRDWRLYIYTEANTFDFEVYRVQGKHRLMLDVANTDGAFTNVEDYDLVPTFDTLNNIQFSSISGTCFISDGTHIVRQWDGNELSNSHYIIDSAIVESIIYGGTDFTTLTLSEPLSPQTLDILDVYAAQHYSVIYDLEQVYPYDQQNSIMRMPIDSCPNASTIYLFGDLIDQRDIARGQRIYVVPSLSEAFAFAVDTILNGVLDSIVKKDTLPEAAVTIDSLLTQFGIDSLAVGVDSVTINLGISYQSVDDYVVVFGYESEYESRIMPRIVDIDEFRLIRPPVDNNKKQVLNWITVGITDETDSADGETYGEDWLWQWDWDVVPLGATSKTITTGYDYATIADFRPLVAMQGYSAILSPRFAENKANNQFTYDDSEPSDVFSWITVGTPDTPGEANSTDDTLLVQWGIDTLFVGETTDFFYFDQPYTARPEVCFATLDTLPGADSDTIEEQIVASYTSKTLFKLKRKHSTAQCIFSWLAVGAIGTGSGGAGDTNVYHLAYDDLIIKDSFSRDADMYAAPYLFKITHGPDVDQTWWADGVPCVLYRDEHDTLALRVIAADVDWDGNTVTLPASDDSNRYVVLRLDQYPPVKFTAPRQNRMWFASTDDEPNILWYSMLDHAADLVTRNFFDDVSTANLEIVGSGDKDELMGLTVLQQWLLLYKRNHVYALGDNYRPFDVYEKSGHYGLWTDGFLEPFMATEFGLNRLGIFGFNGASIVTHDQMSAAVASFFADSLNLNEIDVSRGAIYDNYLIVSFPTGSSTANDKTLVRDTRTGAWAEWSFVGGSYLTLRSPAGLDSLLWGDPDSAAIYVMGGTSDAGTEISLAYQTPYTDFGIPEWEKQARKVYVSCQANSGASLIVGVYANDLQSVEYTDTLVCDATIGYDSPQVLVLDLPVSIETHTHYSVAITSLGADSLKIGNLGIGYIKTEMVGAQ